MEKLSECVNNFSWTILLDKLIATKVTFMSLVSSLITLFVTFDNWLQYESKTLRDLTRSNCCEGFSMSEKRRKKNPWDQSSNILDINFEQKNKDFHTWASDIVKLFIPS